MSIISLSWVDKLPTLQNLHQPMYDPDYDLMECDAVRCGRNLLLPFSKRIDTQKTYIKNSCMRYADLKAIGIKLWEVFYVTLHRLVTSFGEI
jgi:hypothetical protein